MNVVFYLSAAVAVIATIMMMTRKNAMHALLYLILSFLSVSLIFYTLGAPFIAALEVIIYAGAIMVLFIFAIMLLNLSMQQAERESQLMNASVWIAPSLIALVLLGEVVYILAANQQDRLANVIVEPQLVGVSTFSTYLIGVELASILLLASLVGAYHLGYPRQAEMRQDDMNVIRTETAEMGAVGPKPPAWQAHAEESGRDFVASPPEEGKVFRPPRREDPGQGLQREE